MTNRVDQIREVTNLKQWFHVSTAINPADHASRGLTPKQFLSLDCKWLKGPDFLQNEPMIIPPQPDLHVAEHDAEVKVVLSTQRNFAPLGQHILIFSKLNQAPK